MRVCHSWLIQSHPHSTWWSYVALGFLFSQSLLQNCTIPAMQVLTGSYNRMAGTQYRPVILYSGNRAWNASVSALVTGRMLRSLLDII